ncbi:MAG: ABC transporter [Candidatus Nephrothrix sp. EaCA]|nr:MAG: ABC transporter [Candidatus Nephrothrix sp. EaCA]
MKELRYLNKYLLKYQKYLWLGLLFVVVSNIFQILPAPLVREAINLVTDNLKEYQSLEGSREQSAFWSVLARSILIAAALIIGAALMRGLFLYLVRQTIIVMSRHVEYDLKNEIFEHYQSLPMSFYRRNNTGDLLNRISEDVGLVRMYLGPTIMYGMQLITLFLILIPFMFSISPVLTLYAIAPLPVLSIGVFLVNTVIMKRSGEIQKSQSRLSTLVQESFSGIRVIKSFAREKDTASWFARESNEYKSQSLKLTRVEAAFFPLMFGLIGLSVILTVWAGGMEVIGGRLTFGNIAEFIIYVNLLTWPVASIGWTMSQLQRAEASQKRINEFLNTKSEIVSGELEKEIFGKIEFQKASFVYPDTGIEALREVSFSLNAGESLAIIGPTGSGKTTVAHLASRLYDVASGAILIDDTPIQRYSLSHLRSQIGVVPQDVFLFSDTIYNNIAFGAENPSADQVKQAAIEADIMKNIESFPQGLETRVGERGITLSGGQKQRVAIARAIMREPKILILDDALSAVDTKTENTILNSLKEIMKNRTSIIISHRVSSAKLAGRIMVLDDGKVIEEGTHESLYALHGAYREIYDRQMRETETVRS